ncbi:MAG: hydrogenase formation protein HypD [Tannerellaceae bacterium]|jgi:hydrogenase expression/formation protein HypD|nr:hydrogenase formation protein HypD [Tannerellaceae bacterium]
MKYIHEYRDREHVRALSQAIGRTVSRPWHIMEICGGQTHALVRYRLEELLPDKITLLHGPGCPVCVTPERLIDQAIRLSMQPGVALASFGDMLRVPGSESDLLRAKANGADVRLLYSPLDAVQFAAETPDKEVVFFAIGFETTLPVHLAAVKEAHRRRLTNFSLLTAFFTVPPAMEAILSDASCAVNGFLAAGHVCSVTGTSAYYPLAAKYRTPIVITGFEPSDLLLGIYRCVCQLEAGKGAVENAYKRAVPEEGNPHARALIADMLEPCDAHWRGIGQIPQSGMQLREAYQTYDAAKRFALPALAPAMPASGATCIAGEIMQGRKQPAQCPHFGNACRPEHPLGAPMVSAEGVCRNYISKIKETI